MRFLNFSYLVRSKEKERLEDTYGMEYVAVMRCNAYEMQGISIESLL